jgi:CRP-like cAMP-binding protein
MYYPKDYVIFNEGDQGDALYIIKKGDVKIYKNPKTEEEYVKKIADISEGGFFGEMSLISDEPRNASARTISESEIFILSKEDFKKLLDLNTSLAEQISATMVSRLNENNK